MRVSSRLVALAGLALLGPVPLAGQKVPDLSGTWVMVPEKSNFGQLPAPTRRTDVIEHKDPALTVKRTQVMAEGEVTSTMVYGVDGKPYQNKAGDNDVTSVLQWQGDTLVVQSKVSTPNGDAMVVDRYTLSADKRTLTQARVISIQGQELAQTFVLARQ